jgi:hypothetical protein
VSPAVRISAAALAIGLVAYAGWLLVGPDAPKPELTEQKPAKVPRREKPANLNEAGRADQPRVAPARMRTGAATPNGESEPVTVATDMPPETARMQLKVLVEDIEAKAERGETMSQPEWVNMYKRGSELAQTLAKATDAKDEAAQQEFGELNSRFRIGIGKVQPRSP